MAPTAANAAIAVRRFPTLLDINTPRGDWAEMGRSTAGLLAWERSQTHRSEDVAKREGLGPEPRPAGPDSVRSDVVSCQPVQDRVVRLFGLLLLDPVAAVEVDLFDVGHELSEVLGLGHGVAVAVDHQGGLVDDRVDVGEQVPVAIQVPVPVDAAGEPRL